MIFKKIENPNFTNSQSKYRTLTDKTITEQDYIEKEEQKNSTLKATNKKIRLSSFEGRYGQVFTKPKCLSKSSIR